MTHQPYATEDHLQRFLERYPSLLAGDQVDALTPRRWLLIAREMSIPDREEGSGRWFLDHLFLDQDGVPTLVEVKRTSDTRVCRDIRWQLLDYAAKALVYRVKIREFGARQKNFLDYSTFFPAGSGKFPLEIHRTYAYYVYILGR